MTTAKVPSDLATPTPEFMQQWALSGLVQRVGSDSTMFAQYGLQSENDVTKFLFSPGGKQALAEVNKAFLIELILKEERILAQAEYSAAIQRIEAALMLWSAEQEQQTDHQKEYILLQQNEERIKNSAPASAAIKAVVQEHTVADYEKALDLNKALTEANAQEADELQSDRKELVDNTRKINERYTHLDQRMNESENRYKRLDKKEVQIEIDSLNDRIDTLREQINQDIIDGNDDVAMEKKKTLIALYAELANYEDMLSVTDGKKYYADENGERVDSMEKAHYLLDSSKRIQKGDDGTLYLTDKNQNLKKMTVEEKDIAQKAFEKEKPNITVLKKIVTKNRELELSDNEKNISTVDNKLKVNQEEQVRLQNQRTALSAGLSNALNPNATPTPMPTPTNTPASAASRPSVAPVSNASTADFLRVKQSLLQIQTRVNQGESVDSRELDTLKDNYISLGGSAAAFSAYSRGPIKPITMQNILRNMDRLGLDSTNPAITSLQGPLELQQNAADNPQKQETRATVNPQEDQNKAVEDPLKQLKEEHKRVKLEATDASPAPQSAEEPEPEAPKTH